MVIYAIVQYWYDTYTAASSGISETGRELFKTEDGARAWAKGKGLAVVREVKDPEKECELEPMTVHD